MGIKIFVAPLHCDSPFYDKLIAGGRDGLRILQLRGWEHTGGEREHRIPGDQQGEGRAGGELGGAGGQPPPPLLSAYQECWTE